MVFAASACRPWMRSASFLLILLLAAVPRVSLADVPPEVLLNHELTGQEYQRDVTAATHDDGSWTAAWQDFRSGIPSIFVRSFAATGSPLDSSQAVSGAYGLYESDVTPSTVGQPAAAPLGDGRAAVVWYEARSGVRRIVATIAGGDGAAAAPVLVNQGGRVNSLQSPELSRSGDRILIVWQEGLAPAAEIWAQVYQLDLSPIGGNFRVDGTGPPVQESPTVTDVPGGWIAAWSETGAAGTRVVVRKVDREARPVGPVVGVEDAPGFVQREAAIDATDAGDACVLWTESREGIINLKGITFHADLTPAGSPFRVVEQAATISPREPRILSLGANSALTVWTAGPGTNPRFYARAVELPGTPLGAHQMIEDPEVPPGGSLIPRSLTLVPAQNAAARILWHDPRDGWDLVYHMPLDASGTALDTATPVDEDPGTASQVLPSVALLPDKTAFVAWADFQSGGLRIHGANLDAFGDQQGTSFTISELSGGSVSTPATNMLDLFRNRPAVVATRDAWKIAAWSTILPGGPSRLYCQVFRPDGTPLGSNALVPPGDGGDGDGITQGSPAMAPRRDGGYFLAWRDTSVDSEGSIYMLPYASNGSALGDSTIRVIEDRIDGGTSQISPAMASSEDGEAVVVWLDDRFMLTNYDVFVQRFGPAGNKIGRNLRLSPEEESIVAQSNPDVAAARDRYVVVWDDDALAGGGIGGVLVTLPTAAARGEEAREEFTYFKFATGERCFKYPRVAMAGDGRFIVTYWETAQDSARVMAQRFSSRAERIGDPYCVAQSGGRVLALPGDLDVDYGRVQYVFADSRERRGWDVRARRVSWGFDGEPTAIALAAWSATRTADGVELLWSTPSDRGGWSFRVWREAGEPLAGARPGPDAVVVAAGIGPTVPGGSDYRFVDASSPGDGPCAYWIEDEHGELAGPWTVPAGGRAAQASLRVVGNPFRERIAVAWSVPADEPRRITVHAPDGRQVCALSLARTATPRGAGTVIAWDGRDDAGALVPSGVYWLRVETASGATRRLQVTRIR